MESGSGEASRLGWLAGTGAILSVVACYGTLAIGGLLSLLGVTYAINPGIWAGAISLFAVLAVVGLAASYCRHRVVSPLLIGVMGAALIIWAMFVSLNRIVEVTGFTGLIAAAVWDWRLRKCEDPG